jgi:hypothetical protein
MNKNNNNNNNNNNLNKIESSNNLFFYWFDSFKNFTSYFIHNNYDKVIKNFIKQHETN